MRTHQTNPNGGTLYEVAGLHSSQECQGHESGRTENCRILKETEETVEYDPGFWLDLLLHRLPLGQLAQLAKQLRLRLYKRL